METLDVPLSLLERAVHRFHQGRHETPHRPGAPARVITLSRELGSGGRIIASLLAEELGWQLWDREILDVLASQSASRFQAGMFEALDERSQTAVFALVTSLFNQIDKHEYFYLLPKALLLIARNDAVILGRGGHILLPGAFRVRVKASLDRRVRNLVQFEGYSEDQAREAIARTDKERAWFLRELQRHLGIPKETRFDYDLEILTDSIPNDDATRTIVAAARAKLGPLLSPGAHPACGTLDAALAVSPTPLPGCFFTAAAPATAGA